MMMLIAFLALAVQVSAPSLISTIDAGKLKGEPTQLAWSPDGTKLFLQTSERDSVGMTKNPRFFVMSGNDGKPEPVNAPPAWATEYWTWKSAQNAPGSKTFRVDNPKEEHRAGVATSSPMGGAMAKGSPSGDPGGGGTTPEEVGSRAEQTQKLHVFSLTLNGENIGEFINQQLLVGYTFGWSPQSLSMVAYRNQSGKLALMDQQGHKQQVDSTKNVILPAWSSDGSKIAFLQRVGKNKYELYVVTVTP
jgi:WD40-like Beta Propeller Repeat